MPTQKRITKYTKHKQFKTNTNIQFKLGNEIKIQANSPKYNNTPKSYLKHNHKIIYTNCKSKKAT